MRLLVIVVGRPRDAALAAAAQEYERRATHYWPMSVIEVKEESAKNRAPDFVREREGERILAQVPPGATFAVCAEGGRNMSSAAFSTWLQAARDEARDVAIAIGGAFGLSDAVTKSAALRLSLAPWTLPHELARVVLAEQVYRAGTIVRGEPYHK
ncbi:MAG TPA: 23S rRNA (pseudouridine(1915)-N(3))-methyltransferase RlmH [Gemmatimonadaceae bacterium]|nr:23S rRNA (pseudouridine(1915)-N(3))-methyltransferase RlmH [Gemmatimonadaceae bacterium]